MAEGRAHISMERKSDMSIYGWITMILSVGGATVLLVWCFYKALTIPHETERLHGFDAAEELPDRDKH